jgi:hypothetical protein
MSHPDGTGTGTGTVKPNVQQDDAVEKGYDAEQSPSQLTGELDEATERRVRRKLDLVVLSLTFAAYLCAFLDRSQIGNGQTAGMGEDLGFDDAHYQVSIDLCGDEFTQLTFRQVASHDILHTLQ